MRLLIDLGNTRLKWRWWDNGRLLPGGNTNHFSGHLQELDYQLRSSAAEVAHIAAVARQEICQDLGRLLDEVETGQDWLITPARGLGLINSYPQPHKLGIDRWLALAAAYAETGRACCVIDIGTAMTVDLCDERGQHQGGLIAPGPLAMARALKRDTSLPAAAENLPQTLAWAKDTEDALQYGALHAVCGLIERSFRLGRLRHGCDKVLLTGGAAAMISAYLDVPHEIDRELVFKGLALHAAAAADEAEADRSS